MHCACESFIAYQLTKIYHFPVIAEGDLVAISTRNRVNPGPGTSMTSLYDKIETLAGMDPGSLLIRGAAEYDAFSLVFVKGKYNYNMAMLPLVT